VALRTALAALALVAPLVAVMPTAQARSVWPSQGQAAYVLGRGVRLPAGPHPAKAPIASIATAMIWAGYSARYSRWADSTVSSVIRTRTR
jgi:hypothetical protein